MKYPAAQHTLIALALLGLFEPVWAKNEIEVPVVEVIGSTPLAGIGVPREQLPSHVQVVKPGEGGTLADQLMRQVAAVNLNETQGNPYQVDLNYRGFTASPLLGTAQGMSVYLDGVRINEPFGDTVNWDLLPQAAIAGSDVIPGSNPAFGLNTLGGALAMRTKNGFTNPGGQVEGAVGSFGRSRLQADYGGNNGTLGWYGSVEGFHEDGWRDYSTSNVKQAFGKLSFRNADSEADLGLIRAQGRLVGNGLVPVSMLAERRNSIFTHPDQTRNDLTQLSLTGKHWLTDSQSLSGSLYYRETQTRTLNGDLNDTYDPTSVNPDDLFSGAHNRTRTRQHGQGGALQWNRLTQEHQLAIGASYDRARIRFEQTRELGDIEDVTRSIVNLQDATIENQLHGTTRTASVFMTDTWSITPALHLTASARYNDSRVTTVDDNNPGPNNLDGDHHYRIINPALGFSWQVQPVVNFYAGISQGNRVPTPIELGCADPLNPCSLPNAMAADPYLKQVVARTLEFGFRGKFVHDIQWHAGAYRTVNRDDILFVGTSTSQGYFTNFGKTRRQGIELGLNGDYQRLTWFAGYHWLNATFQSEACLLAANNSTRGTSAACPAVDEILVSKGNRLPGLPEHSLKLGLNWRVTDALRLGGDIQAFSGQYVRGNENNQHQSGPDAEGPGRLPGYAVLNLNAEAKLGGNWVAFAKVNNVFDKRYATAGALAENPFASGSFETDPTQWRSETFVAPGAPRSAWLGVRYVFRGK